MAAERILYTWGRGRPLSPASLRQSSYSGVAPRTFPPSLFILTLTLPRGEGRKATPPPPLLPLYGMEPPPQGGGLPQDGVHHTGLGLGREETGEDQAGPALLHLDGGEPDIQCPLLKELVHDILKELGVHIVHVGLQQEEALGGDGLCPLPQPEGEDVGQALEPPVADAVAHPLQGEDRGVKGGQGGEDGGGGGGEDLGHRVAGHNGGTGQGDKLQGGGGGDGGGLPPGLDFPYAGWAGGGRGW